MSDISSDSDEEIFIIQAQEQKIPWFSLNNEERYKILVRELTDHMNNKFLDEEYLKNISTLMGKVSPFTSPKDDIYKSSWTKPLIGDAAIDYTTPISKSIDKENVIIDGESISLQSFDIDLANVSQLGFNIVNEDKNLQFPKVIKRQWRKYFGKNQFNSKNLNFLENLLYNINNYYIQTAHNTIKYNINFINHIKNRSNNLSNIKQTIPNNLIKDRITFNKEINELYGDYYHYDTLSDTDIGRIMFLMNNKNLKNAQPYFIVMDNLEDNYEKYHNLVKLKNKIAQITLNENKEKKIKQTNKDIFEQAIADQLGQYILKKVIDGKLSLTAGQMRLVEKYISLQKDMRVKYEKNTCPHINIRKTFDESLNINAKKELFKQLIHRFGKNGFDKETRFLFCSNCGFNMGCQHEVLMYLHDDTQSMDKLVNEYYKETDLNIECQYCGRKIKDIFVDKEVEFDENNQRIVGNYMEKETEDTVYLRNRINEILIYAGVSNIFNPFVVMAAIAGIVFEKYNDIIRKGFDTNKQLLLKKIQTYAYTWAFLVENKQKKINMFRGLTEDKEIRKTIFKKMAERDPKFIDELERQDLRSNFINSLGRAQNILKSNDFKNYKSINVAKKLFGYKLFPNLEIIENNPERDELIKQNTDYKIKTFRGIPPLQNRNYFKEKYPQPLKYNTSKNINKDDRELLEKEIIVFLESACAGGHDDKIKWKGADINCRSISKTANIISGKMIDKKENKKIIKQKIENEAIKKVKDDKRIGDIAKLNKLVDHFGTNIGIVRDFAENMSKMQVIEVNNIIFRIVREYRKIHNGDFSNSPSTKYIENFNSKKFAVNLVIDKKTNFVDILLMIVKNDEVANYVLEFIRNVNFSISLSTDTGKFNKKIDEDQDEQFRKNWEKYGKMTPIEKLDAEFGGKNLEEAIAIITKKQQEEEEIQMQIEANQDPEFIKVDEFTLDDMQSYDEY